MLIVLGVPLLAIVLVQAWIVYDDFTEPVAGWPPPDERIQFPDHHPWAKRALALFAALPPDGRAGLISEIERAIQPWPSWLDELNRRSVAILCIGENHEPYLRRFLADRLFATLRADALLLEATPREVERIRTRIEAGDEDGWETVKANRTAGVAVDVCRLRHEWAAKFRRSGRLEDLRENRGVEQPALAQHHRPREHANERIAPERQHHHQQQRLAPAPGHVPREGQRGGGADDDAPERHVQPELQRAPGQHLVEIAVQEGLVVLQGDGGLAPAEGGDGEEAEVQHGRERQEHRDREPQVGGPGQAEHRPGAPPRVQHDSQG